MTGRWVTYQLMVNVRPDAEESEKAVFTGWFVIQS